ncbi:MAG: bifunctional protein-serine/threonine kinase/phosphatase [Candidatus Pelagadaptatus aseana]|uniref:protein kinase domain-containing protein n=1 Tax=Candidatus Pelagadaptatus aseana TaxID=3120508 RepID=UPI0039B276F7
MASSLSISSGQYSHKGRKQLNQDFHGIYEPTEPLRSTKGIAIALADGISSSQVSQIASETAVTNFFEDYFSTSETWSVKQSARRVLQACNSWLYSQTRKSEFRYNLDKGYVCTFSGMIIKSATAHLLHAGDSRIYRLNNKALEVLTQEHRVQISPEKHYLKRALGMDQQLDCDYRQINLTEGDTFLLMTDGIYEFVSDRDMAALCDEHQDDLQLAAKAITQKAFDNGSDDNLTVQIVRVDSLPDRSASEIQQQLIQKPFPPSLKPRMQFDGFTVLRQLYASARSHVFLAEDDASKEKVVIKTLATELREDPEAIERFLMEEWIARRIDSAHVLKSFPLSRERQYLYVVTEYIEGQTLTQWMHDNPAPKLDAVREIIRQVARGLLAFHRLEMLHQDLRPENVMIDRNGTVKIIDFGSTWVAGVDEFTNYPSDRNILGTAQYTAPEYFIGEPGSARSDQFSLAVMAYQMLSGRLPYGAEVARATTRAQQWRLKYQSVLDAERDTPAWIDYSLKKALNPDPNKRYEALSEFIYDLRHPNKAFVNQARAPLLERNPVAFWQGVSLMLSMIIAALLYWR